MTNATHERSGARGFTKPPMLGVHFTVPRVVIVTIASLGWISIAAGRLHPVLVGLPVVVVMVVAFATIYHVTVTRWVLRWWVWRRRRSAQHAPWPPARDVTLGDVVIGVVSEHETLITLIELHPDPLAPAIVTDHDERTVNAVSLTDLDRVLHQVLDAHVASADLLSVGYRAAGGFARLYQQIIGPTVAAAERRSWIAIRIGMQDNMAAIDRRGGKDGAARLAAATCLRVADALASDGIDARPATATAIDGLNDVLHLEAPTADHWSHLESPNSYAGVFYADPTHIAEDAAQWWTWPQSRDVTTLVRLTPTPAGTQIAALVRYRTEAATAAPPVSGLGPFYGVQTAVWQQFRVGCLPCEARLPSTQLAGTDPVLAFGPSGPLLGSLDGTRDASAHLPLAGPITVLCQTATLLRQVVLRACATGRPVTVVTDKPHEWTSVIDYAFAGAVLADMPDAEALPENTILVIDTETADWPAEIPQVTTLTSDEACDADFELVDPDEDFNFTLQTRTNLKARVRSVPAHEERRILGVGPQPVREHVTARRASSTLAAAESAEQTSTSAPITPSATPTVAATREPVTDVVDLASIDLPAATSRQTADAEPITEVLDLSSLNDAGSPASTAPPPAAAPPSAVQQPAHSEEPSAPKRVAWQPRTPQRRTPPPQPPVELDWGAMAEKPSRKSAKAAAESDEPAPPRPVRVRLPNGPGNGRRRASEPEAESPPPRPRKRFSARLRPGGDHAREHDPTLPPPAGPSRSHREDN